MIVGILGSGGCGGTFLNWSIQYLAGKTTHLVIPVKDGNKSFFSTPYEQAVPDNPLIGTTAHKFSKTHPNEISLPAILGYFNKPDYDLYTFYYNDSLTTNQQHTNHNQIISDHSHISFITYTYKPTDIHTIFWLQYDKINLTREIFNNIKVNNIELSNYDVWVRREILSLNYPDTIKQQTTNEIILPYANSFQLDFTEFLNNLPEKIIEVFKFLNLTVTDSRWNNWNTIYTKWQKLNDINFHNDFDLIIDNILTNQNFDLTSYNITFSKEVAIACRLLYEHNLAIKASGIDCINKNTQAWHNMLEENIYHSII